MTTHGPLAVVSDRKDKLIRDELCSLGSRRTLELAVVQTIRDCGYSIDEVSAVSGLTPAEIRTLLDKPLARDEVEVLAEIS